MSFFIYISFGVRTFFFVYFVAWVYVVYSWIMIFRLFFHSIVKSWSMVFSMLFQRILCIIYIHILYFFFIYFLSRGFSLASSFKFLLLYSLVRQQKVLNRNHTLRSWWLTLQNHNQIQYNWCNYDGGCIDIKKPCENVFPITL
jgi:hypothetical protein